MTAHDGFTLNDLVYLQREAQRGERRRQCDGHSDNRSCNYGVEGPTADPKSARPSPANAQSPGDAAVGPGHANAPGWRRIRAHATGQQQRLRQDNEISWVDWDIEENGQSLIRFVSRLTALRRRFPILRRNRFLTETYNEELDIKELTWINAGGGEWAWTTGAPRSASECCSTGARSPPASGSAARMPPAADLNAWHYLVDFTLPSMRRRALEADHRYPRLYRGRARGDRVLLRGDLWRDWPLVSAV